MTDPGSAGRPLAARTLSEVVGRRPLGSLVWLTLEVPGWPGARPGQFALLQPQDSCCFLGRALSVASQEREAVSFLIAPVGDGTHELCALRKGERVWVVGPLGNGFDVEALTASAGRLLVVAGGVGVAPFPLLLSQVGDRWAGESHGARLERIALLLGFRDRTQAQGAEPALEAAAALERQGMSCRVEVVTEDGSVGRAERVSDTLRRELQRGDRLVVCGPSAMTAAVWEICSSTPDVAAWFSLEAGMACGVGSCHGCAVPVAGGGTVRVCREGPVFEGAALFGTGRPRPGESPDPGMVCQ